MFTTPLLLAFGAALPSQLDVNPCPVGAGRVVLGPGPEETDVPINTSLWFSLGYEDPDELEVTLTDVVDGHVIPTHREVLYRYASADVGLRSSAMRVTPDVLLAPQRAHRIDWRSPSFGDGDGHIFVTGSGRDDHRPNPPVIGRATPFTPQVCGVAIGVAVEVEETFAETSGLFLLANANGSPSGFERGLAVAVPIGAPHVAVVGTLVAVDLAGNRSDPSEVYRATTPDEYDPFPPSGCVVGPRGDGAAALCALAIAAVLSRRVRAEGRSC